MPWRRAIEPAQGVLREGNVRRRPKSASSVFVPETHFNVGLLRLWTGLAVTHIPAHKRPGHTKDEGGRMKDERNRVAHPSSLIPHPYVWRPVRHGVYGRGD